MSPPSFMIDISFDCSKFVPILIPFMFRAVILKLLEFFFNFKGVDYFGGVDFFWGGDVALGRPGRVVHT